MKHPFTSVALFLHKISVLSSSHRNIFLFATAFLLCRFPLLHRRYFSCLFLFCSLHLPLNKSLALVFAFSKDDLIFFKNYISTFFIFHTVVSSFRASRLVKTRRSKFRSILYDLPAEGKTDEANLCFFAPIFFQLI